MGSYNITFSRPTAGQGTLIVHKYAHMCCSGSSVSAVDNELLRYVSALDSEYGQRRMWTIKAAIIKTRCRWSCGQNMR